MGRHIVCGLQIPAPLRHTTSLRWALDVLHLPKMWPICAWPREPLARAARVQAARARRPRGPCVPLFGGDFLLRPPPAAGTACSRHSCAPQVWNPAGIIFAPPLQLHDGQGVSTYLLYRCAPARLQPRSAPAKVALSHRASSRARAAGSTSSLGSSAVDVISGTDGAGGCVGGRSRRRRVRRCGRRSPTAYPASSARNMCAKSPAPAGRQPARRERCA